MDENIQGDVEVGQQPSPVKKRDKRKATEELLPNKENEVPRVKRHKRFNRGLSAQYGTHFVAPLLWATDAMTDGTGLFVDDTRCIIGTRDGRVIELDHDGKFVRQFRLEAEVGCLLADGDALYAWCHSKNSYDKWNGALYDLSDEVPRKIFNVYDFEERVIHAAIVDGCLAVGDNKGTVALLGCGGKLLWKKEQKDGDGRFFAADESGIYFAHNQVVRRYSLDSGDIVWQHTVSRDRFNSIENGTMDDDSVYIEVSGRVIQMDKERGQLKQEFAPVRHRAEGVCVGNGMMITGSCPTVLFDLKTGQEKGRMDFSARLTDATIKLHKSGKLFVFWDKLYCINVTSQGIQRALGGRSTRTYERDVPDIPEINQNGDESMERTTSVDGAVMVSCIEEKGKVVVRPTSDSIGYNNEWTVSFPVELMQVGRRYAVQRLTPSKRGCFYSVFGKIRCLNEEVEVYGSNTDKTPVSGSGSDDQDINAGSATTDEAPEIPSSSDYAVQKVTAASPSGVPGSRDKEEDNTTDQQSPRERKNTDGVSSEELSSHELHTAYEIPSGVSSSQEKQISDDSASEQFDETSVKLTTE